MSSLSLPPRAGLLGGSRSLPRWLAQLRPGVVIAGLVVVFFILAVIAPSLPATHSAYAINLPQTLKAPSWAHIFGTDASGRDLYSRVIYGARPGRC